MGGKGIGATLRGRGNQLLSMARLAIGLRRFERTGQVGDGREAAAREYVLTHATAGDPDSVLATIDEFARTRSMLVNVGDEKGLLLDAAVRKTRPKLLLELGTYCGYSAVRIGRLLDSGARLVSVEFSAANAEVARAIIAHAGLSDRVTVLVGTIGDGGETMHRLALDHGFDSGTVDLIFLDHAKEAYLADLRTILAAGWLRAGTMVVADNVRVPGVPDYRAYMRTEEGTSWRTVEHDTHVEYQSILKDLVLESEYLG
ncbi:class I SAM-dependent methyltransferase [Nocardia sp. NBC_01503]|uniref:O-methyltransferase n=1 Tax=Nocardia sp. NBC_01503 TaxID=2975997 RepID=UPI002E7BC861|nr:class I SAM-dependent methyltransferase [Nocardia sp. NBC_01503]WTL31075.1 class I SAM-dependent methyltransferase [Nocardia sp. NBC_01503]